MNKERLPAKHAKMREDLKGTITLVNGASGFLVMIKNRLHSLNFLASFAGDLYH